MSLKTHRQGNDFKLTLQVYRLNNAVSITNDTIPEGAVIEDLTDAKNIKLSLYCSTGACTILKKTVNVNVLVAEIPANIQSVGTYYVLLEYDKVDITLEDGLKHFTADFDAFKIVDKSAYADTEGDMSLIGVIKAGLDGQSAFEIWKAEMNDNSLTVTDYLAYLQKPATDAVAAGELTLQQYVDVCQAALTASEQAKLASQESAQGAYNSASSANDSKLAAKTSQDAALLSEQKAKESQDAAKLSETKAGESELKSKTSETNAADSEQKAGASELASKTS